MVERLSPQGDKITDNILTRVLGIDPAYGLREWQELPIDQPPTVAKINYGYSIRTDSFVEYNKDVGRTVHETNIFVRRSSWEADGVNNLGYSKYRLDSYNVLKLTGLKPPSSEDLKNVSEAGSATASRVLEAIATFVRRDDFQIITAELLLTTAIDPIDRLRIDFDKEWVRQNEKLIRAMQGQDLPADANVRPAASQASVF